MTDIRYRESSTICKDVCVLSAIGTAVCLSKPRHGWRAAPRAAPHRRERSGSFDFVNAARAREEGRRSSGSARDGALPLKLGSLQSPALRAPLSPAGVASPFFASPPARGGGPPGSAVGASVRVASRPRSASIDSLASLDSDARAAGGGVPRAPEHVNICSMFHVPSVRHGGEEDDASLPFTRSHLKTCGVCKQPHAGSFIVSTSRYVPLTFHTSPAHNLTRFSVIMYFTAPRSSRHLHRYD